MNLVRVLFLSANPSTLSRVSIDEEQRAIKQRLLQSGLASRFELCSETAVRPEELPAALLRNRPHIVHFSGHGSKSGELLFQANDGDVAPVPAEVLRELFASLSRDILCVVLNACFSETQAAALAEVVPCAVGMNSAVRDSAAIAFVAGFYEALAFGQSIKSAFELGRTATRLIDPTNDRSVPQLRARAGVDVDRLFLFTQSASVEPAPPTAPAPPPIVIPPGRVPARRSIRLLLQAVLPTSSDFEMFCSDSFPNVASRFAAGQNRVDRENQLLSMVKTPLILTKLCEHDGNAVAQVLKERPALLQFE